MEVHHHEVGDRRSERNRHQVPHPGARADQTQITEVHRPERRAPYGKTATFMPKPIVGDNGSGMHVHQSLEGRQEPVRRRRLRRPVRNRPVLHRRHHQARPALNAITNPGTNSYKRLVPGYEAPVKLAYSAKNRSASIRIPFVNSERPAASRPVSRSGREPLPVLRGDDGRPRRHPEQDPPGDPADKNLYDLPPEEDALIPTVCSSLDQALEPWTRTASS